MSGPRAILLILLLVGAPFLAATALAQNLFWAAQTIAQESANSVVLRDKNGKVVGTVNSRWVSRLLNLHQRILDTAGTRADLFITDGVEPNAFAWPDKNGQHVAINLGMLQMLGEDEDAATALLGHETAHLVKGHSQSSQERRAGLSVLGSIANIILATKGISGGNVFTDLGTKLVDTAFSRDQEREADELGVKYMFQIGNDPQGAVRLQEKLVRASGSRILPFLSSHPSGDERIRNVAQLASQYSQARQTAASSVATSPNSPVAQLPESSAISATEPSRNTTLTAAPASSTLVNSPPPTGTTISGTPPTTPSSLDTVVRPPNNLATSPATITSQGPATALSDNGAVRTAAGNDTIQDASRANTPVAYANVKRILERMRVSPDGEKAALEAANSALKNIVQKYSLAIVMQEAVWVDPRIDISDDVADEARGIAVNRDKLTSISRLVPKLGYANLARLTIFARKLSAEGINDQNVLSLANKVVGDLAIQRGLLMVVQQAVWASLSIDLTGAVMQRMEDGPPQPAGISANTKDKPIGQTSAAQRLKELNELFKEGLITEKDFESKKQEILKGI